MASPPPFIPPETATAIRPPEVTPDAPVPPRRRARSLYWQGWGISQISDELGIAVSTLSSWKARDKWDEATSVQRIEDSLECRLTQLIQKEKKTGHDFKEIDLLMRGVEKVARERLGVRSATPAVTEYVVVPVAAAPAPDVAELRR